MFSTARWRLTAVFTGILVAILAGAAVVVFLTTQSLMYDQVDAELSDKAHRDQQLVTDDYKPGGGGAGGGDGHGGGDPHEFDPGGYSYAIFYPDGSVEESSSDIYNDVSPAAVEEAIANGHTTTDVGSGEDQQRAYLLSVDTGDTAQVLAVGRSVDSEEEALDKLQTILLIVVFGSVPLALAGGYVLSGRALRPIKRAIESQQAFIADALHELRTPVAVVRTNAELLERHLEAGNFGQTQNDTRAVNDIIGETERMGKLVEQMLTLAQADAGQSILSQLPLRLDELAGEVGRAMAALAQAKGVALTVDAAPGVWVNGDRDRLREVMVTLVDNAIKYTDAGGRVRIDVARSQRKASFVVSDTGQGIDPEDLKHVFERFYRVDKARSRDEGGTGLGLAIAHHIVTAHGGEIRVESESGKGTRVVVELRLLSRESATEQTRLPEASA